MRKSRKPLLPFFALLVASAPVFSQTAIQRSTELCAAMQPIAAENGQRFQMGPNGGCDVKIDTGYYLIVAHEKQSLHLVMGIATQLFNGEASALWLHLSAFDNLSYAALGTRPQAVFDGLTELLKDMCSKEMNGGISGVTTFGGKTDNASLEVAADPDNGIIVIAAYADVKAIDKMSHLPQSKTDGHVPAWRRILGLSLQVFGAGAQGYANAYRGPNNPQWQSQPLYSAPKTCYTNFIGATAFTNCY